MTIEQRRVVVRSRALHLLIAARDERALALRTLAAPTDELEPRHRLPINRKCLTRAHRSVLAVLCRLSSGVLSLRGSLAAEHVASYELKKNSALSSGNGAVPGKYAPAVAARIRTRLFHTHVLVQPN